ncbi:MoaD/ThiS family protein [Magnetovirga frankeli]|uniref:MoaD/ThiS family protein n=1 Tax=Magnetovirga frankeli TaxID=947516 RepID=UPI003D339F55
MGYQRHADSPAAGQPRSLKLLYFAYLAKLLRRDSEELQVPASVQDVTGLLKWLRHKWRDKGYLLEDERVRVTVNRQFAEPFTRLDGGDEVAITPNSPNPPPPPAKQ